MSQLSHIPRRVFAALAAAGVLLVAVTSSWAAPGAHGSARSAATANARSAAAPTLLTTHKSRLGTIISGRRGYSLYLFQGASCTGACTKTWIPVRAQGKLGVVPGSGLDPRLVGRVRRGRSYQLTYNRYALYRFKGDHKPGQIRGQGDYQYGGFWFVLSKQGKPIYSVQIY